MNKDIQALIEREAEKYTKNQWGKITEDNSYTFKEIYEYCKEDYAQGFKDVLSLFKWRKVSEELPKVLTDVLIKDSFGKIDIGCLYDNGIWGMTHPIDRKITEWKPIE